MLGMQARQRSFYLIQCSYFFSLSPHSWMQSHTAKLLTPTSSCLCPSPTIARSGTQPAEQTQSSEAMQHRCCQPQISHTGGTCTSAHVRLANAFAMCVREWKNLPLKQEKKKKKGITPALPSKGMLTCLWYSGTTPRTAAGCWADLLP